MRTARVVKLSMRSVRGRAPSRGSSHERTSPFQAAPLLAAVCLLVGLTSGCDAFSISGDTGGDIRTESYRPPAAAVVAAPSCASQDVVARLTDPSSRTLPTPMPAEGSLPKEFKPTGLVRCEIGRTGNGQFTIDAVDLGGDIDQVVAALNKPSDRPAKGVDVECGEGYRPPAALWITSASGASRIKWPTGPCSPRDDPLRPLESLREDSRRAVSTVGLPPPSDCRGDFDRLLGRPTSAADAFPPSTRRPAIGLPDRVAWGTICRYRLTGATSGPDFSQLGQTQMTTESSNQLLRAALAAPSAPPCTQPATQVAATRLFRPDGSGGSVLTVELDGCKRLSIDRFIDLRTAPADVIRQVAFH